MKIPKIITRNIDESQYFKQQFTKKQIVIHHTVSNNNAYNVISWWATRSERIGVAFVIDRQGILYQTFSSMYWAHHLGVKANNNIKLNQQSIGIELCNWGPLTKKGDKFYNVYGQEISYDDIVHYKDGFRDNFYYQSYTKEQLNTLKELLQYLCAAHHIPKLYKSDMWSVSMNALKGLSGIYTHCSFRKDKSDCHPQMELIEVLKALK